MAGYAVSPDRAAAIAAGRQVGALFAPRNNPTTNPHADVGQTVRLRTARTTRAAARPIADLPCILRARVIMTADALVRVLDVDHFATGRHGREAERVARLLENAEQGRVEATPETRNQLALLLGYPDWPRAYASNASADRRGRADEHGRVERELIVWGQA